MRVPDKVEHTVDVHDALWVDRGQPVVRTLPLARVKLADMSRVGVEDLACAVTKEYLIDRIVEAQTHGVTDSKKWTYIVRWVGYSGTTKEPHGNVFKSVPFKNFMDKVTALGRRRGQVPKVLRV